MVVFVTAVLIGTTLVGGTGSETGAVRGVVALVALIAAPEAAMALVNREAADWFSATILPGLEFRGGIPPQLRTMIVIPTLLTTPDALAEQIERLEVHYLASQDGDIRFALLSDWTDAATEHAP